MNAKLTLSVDEKVVKKAKAYAKENDTSVSQLVEEYLDRISKRKDYGFTGVVAELAGIIPDNYEDDRADYLEKKYS